MPELTLIGSNTDWSSSLKMCRHLLAGSLGIDSARPWNAFSRETGPIGGLLLHPSFFCVFRELHPV